MKNAVMRALMLPIWLLVVINFLVAETLVNIIWFLFVTVPVWLFRLFSPKKPTASDLIERDYAATKRRMNDLAGQSWRNMAG